MSALFKGFATGVLEGTSDFLQREDIRVKKQTDDALKEFTARVAEQRKDRRAYGDKVSEVIGQVSSRGYNIPTSAAIVKKFGLSGTLEFLTYADQAVKDGNVKSYIDLVENIDMTDPNVSSRTSLDAAKEISLTKFPAISESTLGETMSIRSPLAGTIAGRFFGDTTEEENQEYRSTLIEKMSDSLPDQSDAVSKFDIKSDIQVKRDFVTTTEEKKIAGLGPVQTLQHIIANGTEEEKEEAAKSLQEINIAGSTNLIELLERKFATLPDGEERDAVKKRIREIRNLSTNPSDRAYKLSLLIGSKQKNISSSINSRFSRSTSKITSTGGVVDLSEFNTPQTESFVIEGTRTAQLPIGEEEHRKKELEYINKRNIATQKLISQEEEVYQEFLTSTLITTVSPIVVKEKQKKDTSPPKGALSEQEYEDLLQRASVALADKTAVTDFNSDGSKVVILEGVRLPISHIREMQEVDTESFDVTDPDADHLAFNEKDANEEVEAIKDTIEGIPSSTGLLTKREDKKERAIKVAETQSAVLKKLRVELGKRNYTDKEQQEIVDATTKYMSLHMNRPGLPSTSYFTEVNRLLSNIKELMQKKRKR